MLEETEILRYTSTTTTTTTTTTITSFVPSLLRHVYHRHVVIVIINRTHFRNNLTPATSRKLGTRRRSFHDDTTSDTVEYFKSETMLCVWMYAIGV
mmetsp:Transcript_21675/g.61715  ORF Transcript_21675/g.61715 Transcript_21675/m.61715 type:complete len:96 (-) Transcript_21675:44-331(-)